MTQLFIYLLTHSVLRPLLRNDSAKHDIFGVCVPESGAYDPKFGLGRNFCTMQLATKLHHPVFNRSKVILLTNTQTT